MTKEPEKFRWHVSFLSLFPELYPGVCGVSILARGMSAGLWSYDCTDLRKYGVLPHRQVDDTPYGGGPGMVLRADVLDNALEDCSTDDDSRPLLVMSARGRRLQQSDVETWAQGSGLRIVCGRFEGIDQRFVEKHQAEEISVSDVVLAGGEVASMLVVEACVRLLDGVVGEQESLMDESYGHSGLLEYPHYTRPRTWEGLEVPEVLLSGNHSSIKSWRLQKAEEQTNKQRDDMWQAYCAKKDVRKP